MDKLTMAHEWFISSINNGKHVTIEQAWCYADAMQAEADKRKKAEAERKRKEIREMLNSDNTFLKKEGQHFDDVEEWQPDWSQAPDGAKYWAMDKDHTANFFKNKPEITNGNGWDFGGVMQSNNSHNYQGNWQDSLRKRPEALCEVDWSVAPCWAKDWVMLDGVAKWECGTYANSWEDAPSFGFTGSHIMERPQ